MMKLSTSDSSPCIEALEARIAPASVLVYHDTDGDLVRVTSSRGTLAGHATFDTAADHHQLQLLDLTDPSFAKTNLTIQVVRSGGGDGLANVGYINATGNDLGRVVVAGDLGRISAGDGNAGRPAISQLFVRSMGSLGTSTQAGGAPLLDFGNLTDTFNQLVGRPATGTTGTLPTILEGAGSLLQRPDLSDAARRLLSQLVSDGQAVLSTAAGSGEPVPHLSGNLDSLLTLLSRDVAAVTSLGQANPGLLGQDLTSQLGTAGLQIDPIVALDGAPAPVSVDLNPLFGGLLGSVPGTSQAAGLLRTVGTVLNGVSPQILSNLTPDLAALLDRADTEVSQVAGGNLPVTAGTLHDLVLLESTLESALKIPDAVPETAQPALTSLAHALTDLLGSTAGNGTSGAPALSTSDLNGDLGQFRSRYDLDEVFFNVRGNIGQALIGGSLLGGHTANSGELFASGNIGRVVVLGNVIGGDNLNTGLVHAGGRVGAMVIGGSLLGGEGNNSAALALEGDTGRVIIRGDVSGHDGLFSGSVINNNGSIRSLLIRGALISGGEGNSASLSATDTIGSLAIGHGVFADGEHRAGIVAGGIHSQMRGQDLAFQRITINGLVNDADILAGYDLSLQPINGSAGIGALFIKGNVTASNVLAGAMDPSGGDDFGDANDRMIEARNPNILSRISAIIVRGNVAGTADGGDHFGFEAGQIGRVSINGARLTIAVGAGNDQQELSQATHDVTVREVTAPA